MSKRSQVHGSASAEVAQGLQSALGRAIEAEIATEKGLAAAEEAYATAAPDDVLRARDDRDRALHAARTAKARREDAECAHHDAQRAETAAELAELRGLLSRSDLYDAIASTTVEGIVDAREYAARCALRQAKRLRDVAFFEARLERAAELARYLGEDASPPLERGWLAAAVHLATVDEARSRGVVVAPASAAAGVVAALDGLTILPAEAASPDAEERARLRVTDPGKVAEIDREADRVRADREAAVKAHLAAEREAKERAQNEELARERRGEGRAQTGRGGLVDAVFRRSGEA